MAKRKPSPREILRAGLEQLAFGSVTDAVQLLFSQEVSREMLEGMQLCNVAEIKKTRDGGMEIKFVDRLKAMQCLEQLQLAENGGESSLYTALAESVAALRQEQSCD